MADPIEVNYTPDGDDWAVAVKGRGQTLTARAPGLIAARDRADQLVEKIAPDEPGHKTVVHLLNGDAVEFTTAYLTARLAKTEPEKPVEVPAPAEPEKSGQPEQKPTPRPRAKSDAEKQAKTQEPQKEAASGS
ncbi:hypothetical protein [Actinophytocola sp. NPDC049390]|uniref:hypothetical protein n=1 Tax=Actinophytocola sp. NPDC049390 TaxID=3363894 RepID=UPI0037AABCC1